MLTKSLPFLHITIKIMRPQEVVYKEKVSKKQKQHAAKFRVRIFFLYISAFFCCAHAQTLHPLLSPAGPR